jgi:hypothetical protein
VQSRAARGRHRHCDIGGMARAASPIIKVGLLLAVLMVCGARVRATDIPSCSQEITRCLSACRAVCSRRLADHTREEHMTKTAYGSLDKKSFR